MDDLPKMIDVRKGISTYTDENGKEVALKRGFYWAIAKENSIYSEIPFNEPFIVELRGDSILACGSPYFEFLSRFQENFRIIRRVSVPKV